MASWKTALAANGAGPATQWGGGSGVFSAKGTFGSGTLSLQQCPEASSVDADWVPVGTTANGLAELTEAGTVGFNAPVGWFVRAKLTGATSPSVSYSFDASYGRAGI